MRDDYKKRRGVPRRPWSCSRSFTQGRENCSRGQGDEGENFREKRDPIGCNFSKKEKGNGTRANLWGGKGKIGPQGRHAVWGSTLNGRIHRLDEDGEECGGDTTADREWRLKGLGRGNGSGF